MRPPLLLPCLLALALALGCARTCGTGDSDHVYYPGSGACETVAETTARSEYALLPLYAALAASVYDTDENTGRPKRKTVTTLKEYFDTEGNFYLPEGLEFVDAKVYPDLRAPHSGADLKGLSYVALVQRQAAGKATVLLVFRGTDDLIGDLCSNLRWITRAVPLVNDEYDQLLRILPELGRRLHDEYGGNATIVTVGHSLGGGLAQLAAYGFPWGGQTSNVGEVYAFDPSPVTGFYSIDAGLRERNAVGMRIYRVYDHGELLAYLRLITKAFYPVSEETPAIRETRFNLLRGAATEQHSMRELARALWKAYGRPEPRLPQQ